MSDIVMSLMSLMFLSIAKRIYLMSFGHQYLLVTIYTDENHDIAIAMSPSRADPVLGLNILLHCLGLFKYLNQCH